MSTKMSKDYQEAVKILTSREKFYINLGLERITKILELLGNPQEELKVIHIAGTNGKGSVSAILNAILCEAGYKTGLYTSPHILKYTERIKVNSTDINDEIFSKLISEINKLAKENDIYLTEFELLTACALKYFYENEVDICILETGLGGRFDATNVIGKNLLSIITSISLDHTERLGQTPQEIAFEKAGIIKPFCPVVVSPKNLGFEVIKSQAQTKNAPIILPENAIEIKYKNETNYAIINGEQYKFNLMGLYQKMNLELAYEAIKNLEDFNISTDAIKMGLEKVSWPCRVQYIKRYNLLLDGAHNPDGARVLKESINYYFSNQKKIWIYGTLKNKDYKTVVNTLFDSDDEIYLYDFKHTNHATYDEVSEIIGKKVYSIKTEEIEKLLTRDELKIIAGSIYMLGEILENITELDNIY